MRELRRLRTAAAVVVLGSSMLATGAFGAGSAPPKATVLPSVVQISEVLPYGSKRALIVAGKGITRLRPSNAIDRTFGTHGWVEMREPKAVRVQASGRIVVLTPGVNKPALTRLLPSGRVDRSFGHRGSAPVDLGHQFTQVTSMALQEGMIVVAGRSGESVDSRSGEILGPTILERFKPNGAIDRSFGDGGRKAVTIDRSGETLRPEVSSIQTLPGGRLLLSNHTNRSLIELNPDGSPTSSFGAGGYLFSGPDEAGPGSHFLSSIPPVPLPGGRFVLVGAVSKYSGGVLSYAVATSRHLANGEVDRSYGNRGYAVTPFRGSTFDDGAALRSDGELVVAISRQQAAGKNSRLGALVLRPDGKLDRSVARRGEVIVASDGWAISDGVVIRPGGWALLFGELLATENHPSRGLVAKVSLRSRRGR